MFQATMRGNDCNPISSPRHFIASNTAFHHLVPSRQSPAHINQRRRRTQMRNRPRHSNIAQIRRVMHQQLRNDVEAEQIDDLRVGGRDDLREGGCEGKTWEVLHQRIMRTS
jgi:hypothetical protein